MQPGLAASRTFLVSDDDTAKALGSGSLRVLGTPRLIAWAESVTCAAVERALPKGATSVGARVSLEHLAPTIVGEEVHVRAQLTSVDGRALGFDIEAVDAAHRPVARGRVDRAVVDGDRFMRKAEQDHR
ncbi:thioesterase family protein [Solicola gregarius]|uniref:Thioesterase n=1 Tax=Solicola gregarius TaxID=2908642 RepID=A0AA46YMS8_9ACTN|nr:hotdog domain-containing protein [Solicola gregarius]UYM06028.1 thioesterase [Solicola gregarius]